jgi:hypothetical protein
MWGRGRQLPKLENEYSSKRESCDVTAGDGGAPPNRTQRNLGGGGRAPNRKRAIVLIYSVTTEKQAVDTRLCRRRDTINKTVLIAHWQNISTLHISKTYDLSVENLGEKFYENFVISGGIGPNI